MYSVAVMVSPSPAKLRHGLALPVDDVVSPWEIGEQFICRLDRGMVAPLAANPLITGMRPNCWVIDYHVQISVGLRKYRVDLASLCSNLVHHLNPKTSRTQLLNATN